MRVKFSGMIREEIKSVRIYKTALRCYLETTEENIVFAERAIPLVDKVIQRQNSGHIADNADLDDLTFDLRKSVLDSARVFVEKLIPTRR